MTSPALLIRRVVVEGELSCNLKFDYGLNIIQAIPSDGDQQSTNGSGKTSLIELIQHGLGKRQGSKADWHFRPIYDQVQTLWLEIEANEKVVTIERSLQEINAAARIREGIYVPEIQNTPSELVSIEKMSPILLNLLGIPQVSVKMDDGKLTPLSFPLLMRAFILHQDDSFGAILNKVQPNKRRADIIGFLSGITPLSRFEIEEELLKIQIETQNLENYCLAMKRFLIESGVPLLLEAEAQLVAIEKDLQAAKEQQQTVQRQIRQEVDRKTSSSGFGRIDTLRSQVFGIKDELAGIERNFIGLQKEEERLEEVLASLQVDRKKAQRLDASTTILSSIEFSMCPRCLQDITIEMQQREQFARCCLCNRPLTTTSDTPPRAMPRIQDIDLQIEETQMIIKDVRREKQELLTKLEELRILEADVSHTLEIESHAYISPSVDRLLYQTYEVAQKEVDFAQAKNLYNQALALGEIEKQLEQRRYQQAILEDKLQEARQPNRERLEIFRQIYEHVLRAVDFPGFTSCSINARTMMPEINGNSYGSEGTALKTLATVCYHLALLELARKEQTFFPLMLVIDSPAVGDLNEESYTKLLRYFAFLQSTIEHQHEENNRLPDWQIILTTRKVIEELEPYVKLRISNAPNQKLLREHDLFFVK